MKNLLQIAVLYLMINVARDVSDTFFSGAFTIIIYKLFVGITDAIEKKRK